ncbi:MAG: hypothetical protein J1F23_00865 [Oscillospiraceae bacterium]|nr:hypothetical protein [Oscillospiraceae bacterium]
MNATLIKSKKEFEGCLNHFKDSNCIHLGINEETVFLLDNFDDIHEKLDGKYIFFENGFSNMIICLMDFNYIYSKKNTNGISDNLIRQISNDVSKKIKTIENDVFIVSARLLLSKEADNLFFSECIAKLKQIYREYHFIFCQSDKTDFITDNIKYFHHRIASGHIYHFMPEIDMTQINFENSENEFIYLALPETANAEVLFQESEILISKYTLANYKYSPDNSLVFMREEFSECYVKILKITYDKLLTYQRYLNIFNLKEHFEAFNCNSSEFSQIKDILVYTVAKASDQKSILNKRLEEMISTRKNEWSLIPDIVLMYPVCVLDKSKIQNCSNEYDSDMNAYMHYLDMRLQCETGVPYGYDGADMMARFKKRVSRHYLGTAKFRITEEMIMDILDKEDISVGADIYMHMMVAVDAESDVGVLYVISLSSPFLLSHLLDNVVRNQLMVVTQDGIRNLYEHILKSWNLKISGTPKSYVTIPRDKDSLEHQQLASLLMSETIYEEGEDFSQIVDKGIIQIVNEPYGMGQYDIAYVGATSNAFIQFYPSYRGSKQYRLFWNAVTAFYIELILFEEAAVTRFNRSLVELMSDANKESPEAFLEKNRNITNDYLRSVEFWDVQLNYPSSQRSIKMIRDAFNENDLLSRMERYQTQVQNIFEINKELIDREAEKAEKKSNDNMNFILFVLTVVSTVSAIYQIVDYIINYISTNPIQNLFPIVMNLIVIIGMVIIYSYRKRKRNQ